jgi:hypothetical protein
MEFDHDGFKKENPVYVSAKSGTIMATIENRDGSIHNTKITIFSGTSFNVNLYIDDKKVDLTRNEGSAYAIVKISKPEHKLVLKMK